MLLDLKAVLMLFEFHFCLLKDMQRRSVRSSLHISPKNLRISKGSWSGKNGSKHPKLSISMAENVISYKKKQKKLSKTKTTDFAI